MREQLRATADEIPYQGQIVVKNAGGLTWIKLLRQHGPASRVITEVALDVGATVIVERLRAAAPALWWTFAETSDRTPQALDDNAFEACAHDLLVDLRKVEGGIPVPLTIDSSGVAAADTFLHVEVCAAEITATVLLEALRPAFTTDVSRRPVLMVLCTRDYDGVEAAIGEAITHIGGAELFVVIATHRELSAELSRRPWIWSKHCGADVPIQMISGDDHETLQRVLFNVNTPDANGFLDFVCVTTEALLDRIHRQSLELTRREARAFLTTVTEEARRRRIHHSTITQIKEILAHGNWPDWLDRSGVRARRDWDLKEIRELSVLGVEPPRLASNITLSPLPGIIAGDRFVFVGHKGAGKTVAVYQYLVREAFDACVIVVKCQEDERHLMLGEWQEWIAGLATATTKAERMPVFVLEDREPLHVAEAIATASRLPSDAVVIISCADKALAAQCARALNATLVDLNWYYGNFIWQLLRHVNDVYDAGMDDETLNVLVKDALRQCAVAADIVAHVRDSPRGAVPQGISTTPRPFPRPEQLSGATRRLLMILAILRAFELDVLPTWVVEIFGRELGLGAEFDDAMRQLEFHGWARAEDREIYSHRYEESVLYAAGSRPNDLDARYPSNLLRSIVEVAMSTASPLPVQVRLAIADFHEPLAGMEWPATIDAALARTRLVHGKGEDYACRDLRTIAATLQPDAVQLAESYLTRFPDQLEVWPALLHTYVVVNREDFTIPLERTLAAAQAFTPAITVALQHRFHEVPIPHFMFDFEMAFWAGLGSPICDALMARMREFLPVNTEHVAWWIVLALADHARLVLATDIESSSQEIALVWWAQLRKKLGRQEHR